MIRALLLAAAVLAPATCISNGRPVRPGVAPWFASVRWVTSEGAVVCGGVLVAPEWVMTVAHCVRPHAASTRAFMDLAPGAPVRNVVETHINPAYHPTDMTHDVALLRVSPPVHGVVLPELGLRPAAWGALREGALLQVVGRGLNTSGALQTVVTSIAVPKVASAACVRPPFPLDTVAVGVDLCAGARGLSEPHPSPCRGDSGGPLFDGSLVYGLVSRGDDRSGCGRSMSAVVYTSLADEAGFIKDVTG